MKTLMVFAGLVAAIALSACNSSTAPSDADLCKQLTWYDTTVWRNRAGDSLGIVVWRHSPASCAQPLSGIYAIP